MNNRQARTIRTALQLGLPRFLSVEDRRQYRLAKRLFLRVPRQERGGYIQGLTRVKAEIIRMKAAIDEEKKVQAAENAEAAATVSAPTLDTPATAS